MRGLRSFVVLLVVAHRARRVPVLRRLEAHPGRRRARRRTRSLRVEADKIEEVTVKSAAGEKTTLKKTGHRVADRRPGAGGSRRGRDLGHHHQPRDARGPAGGRREAGGPQAVRPRRAAHRGRVQERRTGAEAADRQKTPTGADLYAKTAGQPKVFLVASFLESTFNKTTFDLRDKTALKFDRDAGRMRSRSHAAERTLTFAKQATATGRSPQPPDAGRFGGDRGARRPAEQPPDEVDGGGDAADLKKYGLDKPAATVRIGTGSSQATLLVGSAADEGSVYAKDASRPVVFTVEASLLDELKKDAGEFRAEGSLRRAGVQHDAGRDRSRRRDAGVREGRVRTRTGKDEEKWRQTAPAAKDADARQVRRAAVGADQRPRRRRSSTAAVRRPSPSGRRAQVRRRRQGRTGHACSGAAPTPSPFARAAPGGEDRRGGARRDPQGARRR